MFKMGLFGSPFMLFGKFMHVSELWLKLFNQGS